MHIENSDFVLILINFKFTLYRNRFNVKNQKLIMENISKENLLTKLYFSPKDEGIKVMAFIQEDVKNFRWKKWMVGFFRLLFIIYLLKLIYCVIYLKTVHGTPIEPEYTGIASSVTAIPLIFYILQEELMFRLPIKHNYLYLLISMLAFARFFVRSSSSWFNETFGSLTLFLQIACIIVVPFFVFPLVKILYKPKYMLFWMIASCLGFSLMHLRNYSLGDQPLVNLFMVLPQLLGGILFLICRKRYGFLTGWLLHFSFNASIILTYHLLS
jgi:hypothetical protein